MGKVRGEAFGKKTANIVIHKNNYAAKLAQVRELSINTGFTNCWGLGYVEIQVPKSLDS
jgi:hypothetical protein